MRSIQWLGCLCAALVFSLGCAESPSTVAPAPEAPAHDGTAPAGHDMDGELGEPAPEAGSEAPEAGSDALGAPE